MNEPDLPPPMPRPEREPPHREPLPAAMAYQIQRGSPPVGVGPWCAR